MTDLGMAAKLRAAFELSPTVLAVADLETGCLLEVNDAFLRTTGYGREEVIGKSVGDLGLWADPRQRAQGLAALRAGHPVRDLEARLRTKGGQPVVAIVNADVVTVEGRPCILTAFMDITARVRAEQALRESERRFARAFNANPLPMFITSLADGRLLDVNAAALRHSGYFREEMMGCTELELDLWGPGPRDRMLEMLRAEGQARDLEVDFQSKTGDLRRLLVNAEVITYGGEPAVLRVSLDITERTRAEGEHRSLLAREQEARREAEEARESAEAASRAKDEFLSSRTSSALPSTPCTDGPGC